MNSLRHAVPLAAILLFPAVAQCAPLAVVAKGKSDFAIVIPRDAPASLRTAASELQQDVLLATGVKLPVMSEGEGSIPEGYISLGNTAAARAAGLKAEGMAAESYRTVNRGRRIFILGPDTPDGQVTSEGGTSAGTANGVYAFLEQYLDVRWLFPGDLGRDIPSRDNWSPDVQDTTNKPAFLNRRLAYIQNELPAVKSWEATQKIGYSFQIQHGHNWNETVTPDMFATHPEWFAESGGQRVPPTGWYKLETTNPQLVKFFADKAVQSLKASPAKNTFSLSPSDGRGWSQSKESLALNDPPKNGFPSVTPLILKFYREVSDAVAKQYPQGKLSGYIYADYMYPPTKGGMTLPSNFYPVLAPSLDYGYTLYREDVQRDFDSLLGKWSEITPHLFYYDLPAWILENSGTVTPVGVDILNHVFPRLVKAKVQGVYIYGASSWSQAAVGNYVLAKMLWNPQLDARQLQREWLTRAYGPEAGADMEVVYAGLEKWFGEYYRTRSDASYHLTEPMLKAIYGARFPELEAAFLKAKSRPMTVAQQNRLKLIEDNLCVLQWRLRQTRALPANFNSSLAKPDEELLKLLMRNGGDFAFFPSLFEGGPTVPKVRAKVLPPLAGATAPQAVQVRGKNALLLMSREGGPIQVTTKSVSNGTPFVSYTVTDPMGDNVISGILQAGKSFSFAGQVGVPYYLVLSGGIVSLEISGAGAAYQTDFEDGRLHLFGKPSTLYLTVPPGRENWTLTLASDTPGETARLRVWSPDGKEAALLETSARPAQSVTLKGDSGIWKLAVEKADAGVLDDVYLTLDRAVPQWLSIDGRAVLEFAGN